MPGATGTDQVVQRKQDPVQRAANISAEEEAQVSERAGAHLTEEAIDDRAGKEPRALAARDAASMAANPAFEAAAMEWEDIFGGVAYSDELAIQVVDEGCSKAVAYMMMRAFTTGSLGVKIAHLENFCNKVLAQDILSLDERSLDERSLDELLEAAGIDREDLDDGIVRVREGNSRYAFHDTRGEAKEQWHMRVKRHPDQPASDISTRTVEPYEEGDLRGLIGWFPDERAAAEDSEKELA